jgi:hypothetical protein
MPRSINSEPVVENFNQMIGKRRIAARPAMHPSLRAAIVVNGAVSMRIRSAGLCLRGNEKSMCCKYERKRADPSISFADR